MKKSPRLIAALARRSRDRLTMEKAISAGLWEVCDLAAQRTDCRDAVATIRSATLSRSEVGS